MDDSSPIHMTCPACRRQWSTAGADMSRGQEASGEIPIPGRPTRAIPRVPDRKYDEEVAALCRLDVENRRPGADLRDQAHKIVADPMIDEWILKSDQLSDPKIMKGRADLVRQRRLGILRFLEGEDRGFPICQPVPRHPLPEGQGYWLMRLRDELEWLVLPVLKPTNIRPFARPTKDRLNHREARAILDWKASHLDMWLADRPHLVGGRLALDASRGVIFDTEAFVRWVYALMN